MVSLSQLDRHLSQGIRRQIEERYLSPINARARLEEIVHDPLFYQDPAEYPPFFSDHGVVHHRDVACQVLGVLDATHGLLIPTRDPRRLESMKGYGVILAYLHDLGMTDFSPAGRATHADAAAQTVFASQFDPVFQAIWEENAGNLAWRLTRLAEQGALEQPAPLVLREMLSMATCHSKSRVPVETLNDVAALRRAMQDVLEAPTPRAWPKDLVRPRVGPSPDAHRGPLACHYDHFQRDSFRWLVSGHERARALVTDVVDTLRALRCADALRQRGTVLKTSGGYEVFVDRETANAIYALHLGEDQMFLLQVPDAMAAGEANLASSQLDPSGNLRIAFHRGAFPEAETTRRAARNLALVINDIQGDALESFRRPDASDAAKAAQEMEILLESVDDNLGFADLVWIALEGINPDAAARTRCVPSLQHASDLELGRYLQAEALDWNLDTRRQALQRIARSGHQTDNVDPGEGFRDVRLAMLEKDEVLIEAGAPSGFVYIPLGEGLRAVPLGGYASSPARPWVPLGITGVIRGAARNGTVTAEQDVALLMLPKEVYLRAWHRTYGLDGLLAVLAQRRVAGEVAEASLTLLEKRLILKEVPLFAEIPGGALAELASIVIEVRKGVGQRVLEKGDPGDNMYVIASGRVRVHDGQHTLDYLDRGEIFGEMALLGPETRMASVTAVVETHLLRLHREPFHSLLARHPEMAQGMIRVLMRRLRAQAQEVTTLRARLQQSEG